MKDQKRKKKTKEELVVEIKDELYDTGELSEDQLFTLMLLAKTYAYD